MLTLLQLASEIGGVSFERWMKNFGVYGMRDTANQK